MNRTGWGGTETEGNNMMSNKPRKRLESYVGMFLIAVGVLAAMGLNAWMSAGDACRGRWKNLNLATEYTRNGCLVEISPDVWVPEKKAAEEIKKSLLPKIQ